MSGPAISDHALVRFLERAGGLDIEQLREDLSASLSRSHEAALQIGICDHLIKVGGMTFVVRGATVTTVLDTGDPKQQAYKIGKRR